MMTYVGLAYERGIGYGRPSDGFGRALASCAWTAWGMSHQNPHLVNESQTVVNEG